MTKLIRVRITNIPIYKMNFLSQTDVKTLPIRALFVIKAFSQPLTRPDWRTCKSRESQMIKLYDDTIRERNTALLKKIYGSKTYGSSITSNVSEEIYRWTLYGRCRILNDISSTPRFFRIVTPQQCPQLDDPTKYIYRYKFMIFGHPEWVERNGEWVLP